MQTAAASICGTDLGLVGWGDLPFALGHELACLVAAGHRPVVEARHPHQQAAAERLGARVGRAENADVVIEATGSTDGVARCTEVVRPAGRLVLVGVFHDLVPLPGLVTLKKE